MNKQIIDGVDILKEKINICFILLINKLETPEIIEQTIYDHLDAFVEEWNKQLEAKQQECEELKEQLERADEDIKMKCTRCAMTNQLDEQLDQLKAENDELKKKVYKYEQAEKYPSAFLWQEGLL